jgi:hypothetical protein
VKAKLVDKLRDAAFLLASKGREDPEAVSQIRDAAGRDPAASLTRAADRMTMGPGPLIEENERWERAYRLLRAAAANGAVEPVDPERERFFEEVRLLQEGSLEEGWARLVSARPDLEVFEATVREAGRRMPGGGKRERINALEDVLEGRLGNSSDRGQLMPLIHCCERGRQTRLPISI